MLVGGATLLVASKRDIEAPYTTIEASTEHVPAFIPQMLFCVVVMDAQFWAFEVRVVLGGAATVATVTSVHLDLIH